MVIFPAITEFFMDSLLTTTCSSSFSSSSPNFVYIELEKMIVSNQVWSSGCYSYGGSESRSRMQNSSLSPSTTLKGTIKRKIENSSAPELMIPQLCGIILSLVILNSVIILHDFYSNFRCILSVCKSFLRFLSYIWNVWAATTSGRRPIEKCCTKKNVTRDHHQRESSLFTTDDDERNVSLLEVNKVIDRTLSSLENLDSADKIAGLFEEEEPSLEEMKEAFDVFDENKDGFIDAKELRNVLLSLGFMQASEEDCKRMIKGFDDNLDGRIDLREFIKVMERSFG